MRHNLICKKEILFRKINSEIFQESGMIAYDTSKYGVEKRK